MADINEVAAIDPIAPPEGDTGQRQPNGNSASSEENFSEENADGIQEIAPVDGGELPRGPSDAPPENDALAIIRPPTPGLRGNIRKPNLDNPLRLLETNEMLYEGVQLALRHDLKKNLDILKRAAIAERDDTEALSLTDSPEEEKSTLKEERKVTFSQQSRSLRSAVLVVGGLSGLPRVEPGRVKWNSYWDLPLKALTLTRLLIVLFLPPVETTTTSNKVWERSAVGESKKECMCSGFWRSTGSPLNIVMLKTELDMAEDLDSFSLYISGGMREAPGRHNLGSLLRDERGLVHGWLDAYT
ncbi:hypothetical protein FGG08_000169 [Glutinoglossum americanum]|uniref:Uncharacterized protein n=1 Tax=Glutinoglossum americanum TaxID=1670608 RepID=A0A9P8L418_9PEZI|nr:hypothetical protein FGG08_000169 [Glutinoglossum americanum]